MRLRPIFAADIQRLGGSVTVNAGRDRIESTPFYTVEFVSRGGDIAWRSSKIPDVDRAIASARTLAEFVGGQLLERPPPESKRAALAGDPNCATWKHSHPTEIAEAVQAKRLSHRFGMPPATAATVARLAFGMTRP
jgi:hypothetical protein